MLDSILYFLARGLILRSISHVLLEIDRMVSTKVEFLTND
jgi:hypothetical protein